VRLEARRHCPFEAIDLLLLGGGCLLSRLLLCLRIRLILLASAANPTDEGSGCRTRARVPRDRAYGGTAGGAAGPASDPAPFALGGLICRRLRACWVDAGGCFGGVVAIHFVLMLYVIRLAFLRKNV
jgi:hypothetical protein